MKTESGVRARSDNPRSRGRAPDFYGLNYPKKNRDRARRVTTSISWLPGGRSPCRFRTPPPDADVELRRHAGFRLRSTGALDGVAGLQERIEKLERQANRTSRNSSVAPSSDPLLTRQQRRQLARERAKKQLERERREARERGGQRGMRARAGHPSSPSS